MATLIAVLRVGRSWRRRSQNLQTFKDMGWNGKDKRQRQPKFNLLAIAGDNLADRQAISDLLEKLILGRLLVTDSEGENWIDLAYEALMGE